MFALHLDVGLLEALGVFVALNFSLVFSGFEFAKSGFVFDVNSDIRVVFIEPGCLFLLIFLVSFIQGVKRYHFILIVIKKD